MKNIIIVNDYANIEGGATQVAILSARGLAEVGLKIIFVYASGEPDISLIHPNIKLINFQQYDLLSNPSRLNASMVGLWNNSVEKQMRFFLKSIDEKNTIIHIHSWTKALSPSVISVIRESNFPFVMTMHDYFSICPNGGLYNYKSQKICEFKPMSIECLLSNCDARSYPQKLWRVLRQLICEKSGISNHTLNIISVTSFSKNILYPYLSEDTRYWDVPNPIDIMKDKYANPSDTNIFSFIGRFSVEKGADLFAEASKSLNFPTRFVGSGDMENKLKTITPDAEFTGWAKREDVIKYIKNSRAIIFPSRLYETQGLVVPEAAALGVPSIVSDTSAASEFIDDGKTGLLFEAGNLQSLINKMTLLDKDPNLAKELGLNAYKKYWNKPYDIQFHVNKLIDCYQTILKQEVKK